MFSKIQCGKDQVTSTPHPRATPWETQTGILSPSKKLYKNKSHGRDTLGTMIPFFPYPGETAEHPSAVRRF